MNRQKDITTRLLEAEKSERQRDQDEKRQAETAQEHKRSMQGPDTDAQDQPPPFIQIRLATHGRSIQLGHVWTAPWQELSDVLQYWSGAVTCPACLCGRIWPLALMLCADRVPNKNAHSRRRALTQAGSPDPRNNRICITSSCPRQLVLPIYQLVCFMPPAAASAPCISRPRP